MGSPFAFPIFVGVLATLLTITNADEREAANYDVRAERTFEGFVIGKEYMLDGLVYIRVKTADAPVEVQLGPKQSLECSKFVLKPGELVVVVGVSVGLNKYNHRVVLGRIISGMNGTLFLRDDRGVRYKNAIRCEMIR